ncbi:MAG: tetratricopeptide repeat protein [Gammaproteobacteria bacterium]|nr:tetratricopeptide repeat protein [Gammaproteobacteria bacterium]
MIIIQIWLRRILWVSLMAVFPVNAQVDITDYLARAEQAQKQGDLRRAEMYLTRIVRADPENTDFRSRLGEIQLRRGRLSLANDQADKILARDANHRAGLILKSKLSLRAKSWEDAFKYLQTLLNRYPQESYTYLGLASVYSFRKDKENEAWAQKKFQSLLTKKADNNVQ